MPLPQATDQRPYKDLTKSIFIPQSPPISGGGFSDVFRATLKQGTTTCEVVVKALRLSWTDVEERELATRRLYRETYVWHGLDNPNILPFLGTCDSKNLSPVPGMVSPYCPNGDIISYLNFHRNANKLELIRGVAQGLKYLHSSKVIHGDLKCTNILVDAKGRAVLCDFGRSKILEQSGFTTIWAQSTGLVAPELFGPIESEIMPPDCIQNIPENFAPTLTTNSDTYAFAMAMLHILSGKKPFYHVKNSHIIHGKVYAGMRPDFKHYDLSAVKGLEKIIVMCWAQLPSHRPAMDKVVIYLSQFT
ncbi:kinase-like domain-containing protein [Mycena floridula]|nr:kinase-like domain-containing protein [Mycena floridula]